MFSCEYCKSFMNSFFTEYLWCLLLKTWVYSIDVRFTQGLLQLLFTFFDWKTFERAHHILKFFISFWQKFLRLIKFIRQCYISLLNFSFILKNIFLFLSTFLSKLSMSSSMTIFSDDLLTSLFLADFQC